MRRKRGAARQKCPSPLVATTLTKPRNELGSLGLTERPWITYFTITLTLTAHATCRMLCLERGQWKRTGVCVKIISHFELRTSVVRLE